MYDTPCCVVLASGAVLAGPKERSAFLKTPGMIFTSFRLGMLSEPGYLTFHLQRLLQKEHVLQVEEKFLHHLHCVVPMAEGQDLIVRIFAKAQKWIGFEVTEMSGRQGLRRVKSRHSLRLKSRVDTRKHYVKNVSDYLGAKKYRVPWVWSRAGAWIEGNTFSLLGLSGDKHLLFSGPQRRLESSTEGVLINRLVSYGYQAIPVALSRDVCPVHIFAVSSLSGVRAIERIDDTRFEVSPQLVSFLNRVAFQAETEKMAKKGH